MIGLLQRVTTAAVDVGQARIAEIGPGLLVLVAVEQGDTPVQAQRLIERVVGYRVFADEQGKMNRSVADTRGALLLVPQFTLAADTDKGLRPGFSRAASPAEGQRLFVHLVAMAWSCCEHVQTGRFGADMKVSLINDGPVTFWLEAH